LVVLASCLVLFPRLLLFISEAGSDTDHRTALTPLESFLALHFGIFLSALALALVLNIPTSAPPVPYTDTPVPYHPLLGPLTLASVISAFLAWNTKSVGPLASVVFTGSSTIALWGLWVIVFGNESLKSKKTGADKRTSAFIFGNKSAASVQKKRWRKEHS
ncbi:hypothetical protein BDQ17DRAFT_1230886, partial [Cyathus striatus]